MCFLSFRLTVLYVFTNQSEYAYNKYVLNATDKVFTRKDEAESEEIKTVQYDRCQTGRCVFLGESLHVFVMIFGLLVYSTFVTMHIRG